MNQSHTATILESATLYGNTPADVLMTYEAPCQEDAEALLARAMDSMITLCADTCNELDAQDLCWNFVNLFHRKAQKLEREIDTKMQTVKSLSASQDGSEIASHELEEATAVAHGLQRRLEGINAMRERAAEQFEALTGDVWMPKSGSRRAQGTVTASMYDAKEIQQTRLRKKNEIDMPKGSKIIVTGGTCHDHNRLYAYLDKIKAQYDTDNKAMVLLHCGQENGIDKVAATWARNRNVAQVAFKPDWKAHKKAAGFKRNDAMLAELPEKVIVINSFSGVTDNLADKAHNMGIRTIRQQEDAAKKAA